MLINYKYYGYIWWVKRGIKMNIMELNEGDTLIVKLNYITDPKQLNILNDCFDKLEINLLIIPVNMDLVGIKHANKL